MTDLGLIPQLSETRIKSGRSVLCPIKYYLSIGVTVFKLYYMVLKIWRQCGESVWNCWGAACSRNFIAKVQPASERDVSLAGKNVSNLGFLLFRLCHLTVLLARHAVGVTGLHSSVWLCLWCRYSQCHWYSTFWCWRPWQLFRSSLPYHVFLLLCAHITSVYSCTPTKFVDALAPRRDCSRGKRFLQYEQRKTWIILVSSEIKNTRHSSGYGLT